MTYTIRKLCPELANTFVEYLENLDFHHAPHWASCFCRFYHTDCTMAQWQSRAAMENRTEALEQINSGNMKGYLAFDGEKCIGWCNANDASLYIRLQSDLEHIIKGQKAGLTICFVIHPEYRRQGVARLLLRQALKDFKAEGFDIAIALPVEAKGEHEKLYRGSLNMYREFGFEEIEKDEDVYIMRLRLK